MDVQFSIPDDLVARITEAWHRCTTTTREVQERHLALARMLGEFGCLHIPDVLAMVATDARRSHNEMARAAGRRLQGWPALPALSGAHRGAFFVYRSDTGNTGSWSTLSLHRVGEDLHLRVQHDGGSEYAAAVLPPREARDLAAALTGEPGSVVTR